MENIDIEEQAIVEMSRDLSDTLLKDRTTGFNIRWATDNYKHLGPLYFPEREITTDLIIGENTRLIQPRVLKSSEEQTRRTREKAEVFTPSWICNCQNNLIDEVWFGRTNVFNTADGTSWTVNKDKIATPQKKRWKDYVDAQRLEISCGEAPYLVSRYDTVTGKQIPVAERIGLLDRKLRVVNENVKNDQQWLDLTIRAFQSVYGYDYQGDNVLLARQNLLLTYWDYYEERFGNRPDVKSSGKIAEIISWNIWQMDGITLTAPFSEVVLWNRQLGALFGLNNGFQDDQVGEPLPCIIKDWRKEEEFEFRSMLKAN